MIQAQIMTTAGGGSGLFEAFRLVPLFLIGQSVWGIPPNRHQGVEWGSCTRHHNWNTVLPNNNYMHFLFVFPEVFVLSLTTGFCQMLIFDSI